MATGGEARSPSLMPWGAKPHSRSLALMIHAVGHHQHIAYTPHTQMLHQHLLTSCLHPPLHSLSLTHSQNHLMELPRR